jgi:hypothetical protein
MSSSNQAESSDDWMVLELQNDWGEVQSKLLGVPDDPV